MTDTDATLRDALRALALELAADPVRPRARPTGQTRFVAPADAAWLRENGYVAEDGTPTDKYWAAVEAYIGEMLGEEPT